MPHLYAGFGLWIGKLIGDSVFIKEDFFGPQGECLQALPLGTLEPQWLRPRNGVNV